MLKNKKGMKILICIFLITTIGFFNTIPADYVKNIEDINIQNMVQTANETSTIDELTWSVLRYQGDLTAPSCNFGTIQMSKPSPGTIVIPINMITEETCKAAVSVYHLNKLETVEALDEYDIEHMIFRIPFMLISQWAHSQSLPCYEPTSYATEMRTLGETCLRANLVGHCYSQSLFNTAVLRLCGFSAEEVFTLTMPLHAVTIFKLHDEWFIFDSTPAEFARRGLLDSLIRDSMDPPLDDIIMWLENDKYFINFGAGSPTYRPYLEQPFSNMEPGLLTTIMENITEIFNNSQLGYPGWNIQDFIDSAIPCPCICNVSVPYSVSDVNGEANTEKAQSLMNLNRLFMKNQTGGETLNQYDRSFYGKGELDVDYPQAYANAAKYAVITSWFAAKIDTIFPKFDCLLTSFWINSNVRDKTILPVNHVAQSDLLYLRHAGSTIDQAILAYGTLRNMKNGDD
ncbi:MAG: hypothetical protein QCI00_07735, partial [Candidatus Thermoplasmatota archaeon]|nr:hypothetical protein [Candidatus Thermoplasmatota archaeon]